MVAVPLNGANAVLQRFLQQQQLPAQYLEAIDGWYRPLASEIARLRQQYQRPVVLGVQGAQGTGKSTLAELLAVLLGSEHNLSVACLSLDDFYLCRADRQRLAEDIHPLLATRGVPGTHNVELALATIAALRGADDGASVALPRFDKAIDDCCDREQWPIVAAPVDVVVLEGWCLGVPPQSEAELQPAINVLERELDADASWRRYVNQQLAGSYQQLFAGIDFLVVLQAPSFDCVYRWRGLQEQKLAARSDGSKIMDSQQLQHFIAHYERLTRHCLECLPTLAQRVYQLNDNHQLVAEISGAEG